MVLIYATQTTSRLEFILNVIFREILGIKYKLITDPEAFAYSDKIKIAYAQDFQGDGLHILPSGLLEQTGIKRQDIPVGRWEDLPILFSNGSEQVPFDLFAAAFYLVSRYEEYLPYSPDPHGRFPAEESLAFQTGFLRLPIVDLWARRLARLLGIERSCPNIQAEHYSFQLTVDIDQPWLYRNKGWLYSSISILRDLLMLRWEEVMMRIKTLLQLIDDPGNTFGHLNAAGERLQQPMKYFVLCRGRRRHDKNRSVGRKAFHELLQSLDHKKRVGIHPSYASNRKESLLEKEIALFTRILGRKPEISRQHYLIFQFPETCQRLIEQGIKEDYSLGFSSQTGFRTGMARACNFYDLQREKETELRLVPLIIMDRTLKDYLRFNAYQAQEEFIHYNRQIRNVGGEFVCLWHNDALSNRGEWRGWKQVFDKMIEQQAVR